MVRAARAAFVGLLGVVGAAVAGTGCATTDADWRERYLEKERDAGDLAAQLSTERSSHAAAVAQLEESRNQVSSLQRENEALRGGRVADVPAASGDGGAGVNARVENLRKAGHDVHVTPEGDISITIPADINFGAGSKDLTAAGKKAVDQILKELEGQFAGYSIRIEGHTDADPIKRSNFKDNWELGSERSLSVLRYMAEHSIAAERLQACSRGDTMPVADNKSDKGKAKNRRVEVVVVVPKDVTMAK
jgi:flagellar motor protein MotB